MLSLYMIRKTYLSGFCMITKFTEYRSIISFLLNKLDELHREGFFIDQDFRRGAGRSGAVQLYGGGLCPYGKGIRRYVGILI